VRDEKNGFTSLMLNGESVGFRVLQLEVDESEQAGCEDDQKELIPVEEWKAQKGRRESRIESRKAESQIRKDEQELPADFFAGWRMYVEKLRS